MGKWLFRLFILLMILAGMAFFFKDRLMFEMFKAAIKPGSSFAEMSPPPAPDYSNPDHWAALPDREDFADIVAPGLTDNQAEAHIDVFFVHPTTYITSEGWNAPLDHKEANWGVEYQVLIAQASAFNGSARVYAPRYRQATLYAFYDRDTPEDSGSKALDLAYEDVLAAYEYYIEHFNKGRPFILASHSQGSRHLDLLMRKRVTGSPELERLVAAYPIGTNFKEAPFLSQAPDIPLCTTITETGCLTTWNARGPKSGDHDWFKGNICVNPLQVTHNDEPAEHGLNTGALYMGFDEDDPTKLPELKIVEGVADAQCINDVLVVSELRTGEFSQLPATFGKHNYHRLDYNLFYMNLRHSVALKTDHFLSSWNSRPIEMPIPDVRYETTDDKS